MGLDYISEQAWSRYGTELANRGKRLKELSEPAKNLEEANAQLEEIKDTTLNYATLDDKEAWKLAWWDKAMEVEKFKREEEEKFEREEELREISGVTKAEEVEDMSKKVNNKWWNFSVEFSSSARGNVHTEGKVYAKSIKDAYDKVIERLDDFGDFEEDNIDFFEVWYCEEDNDEEVIITETRAYPDEE